MHRHGAVVKVVVFGALLALLAGCGTKDRSGQSAKRIGRLKVKDFYLGMTAEECVALINEKYKAVFLRCGTAAGTVCASHTMDKSYYLGDDYSWEVAGSARRSAEKLTVDSFPRLKDVRALLGQSFPVPDCTMYDRRIDNGDRACNRCAWFLKAEYTATWLWKNAFYLPDKRAIYRVDCFAFDSSSTLTSMDWKPGIVNQLFNAKDMSAEEYAQTFMESYKIKDMVSMPDGHGGTRWEYSNKDGLKVEIGHDKRTRITTVPKAVERKFD